MENRFEEVKEEVEHLEHLAPGRLKVVVTVSILLVTFATALGALLAAEAAGKSSVTQRDRQVLSAQAVQDSVQAANEQGVLQQVSDDSTEAGWRRTFSDLIATDASVGADVRNQMQSESAQAEKQRQATDASLPVSESQLSNYQTALNKPATIASQAAASDAIASTQWEGIEGSALATVSMLALALFLLGLALTITHRPTASGFVALALVILAVSCGRLGLIASKRPTIPSPAAIQSYATGDQDLAQGNFNTAISQLQSAVRASPAYEAAWEDLAQAEFSLATPQGYAAAERDQNKALDLKPSGAQRGPILNDLGYFQLVDGHVQQAGATLHEALTADPQNEVTLASLAEQALIAKDPAAADSYLQQALAIVKAHGPYFREQYFQAFRSDQDTFYTAGLSTPQTDQFFTEVKQAEASLDSLDSTQPGDAHGATVTHLVARAETGQPGKDGIATIGFDYTGFRAGDHLAIRWYQDGVTYEATDSQADIALDSSWAGSGSLATDQYDVPVVSGSHTVEIYLNGVLLGSTTFDMPASA